MDTEALIKMVKAKHAQSQSAADKHIQEKLGQLSSKLSWVVEYPSQKQDQAMAGQSGQGMVPGQNPVFPPGFHPGMLGQFPEDDEEEEDYDGEYDEDELDEQELEALAYMRKMRSSNNAAAPSQVSGHFEGEIGEEEYGEDYDQEMEGFDVQHRVYNPMEDMNGPEFAGAGAGVASGAGATEECSEDQGFTGYQRSASPSLENYLMIGSMMAKCLVCNKIVRKSEVKQHNQLHDDEYEEEGEEGEEEIGEDGGEGYMEGREGLHEEGEGLEEKETEYEGEEEYHEEEEYLGEEETEGDINMAEFTAQPLVAERLNPQQLALPCNKSEETKLSDERKFTCDICNKSFSVLSRLDRHKKTHTTSKDFVCPVCPKKFKLKVYLGKHLKKIHPEYESQQGDGDGGAVAQDGGAEEEKEEKTQT